LEVAIAGVPWAMIELTHPSLLASLQLDHRRIADATRRNRAVGITVFARTPGSAAIARMRSFAPAEGIYEDPVCGSCAGSLASLLRRDDPALAALPEFLFEQGLEIGRTGCVRVIARDGGTLAVGGGAVTVMRGQLAIEE
jgi:PhzF family phenazine biosynthesis protein